MEGGSVIPFGPLYNNIDYGHARTLDVEVCHTYQCGGHPTIYVAALPSVWMIPLHFDADSYVFQNILRIHAKEAVHRYNERVEVAELTEACFQVLYNLVNSYFSA